MRKELLLDRAPAPERAHDKQAHDRQSASLRTPRPSAGAAGVTATGTLDPQAAARVRALRRARRTAQAHARVRRILLTG
ncbi:hypothetical protein Tcur_3739 [Thermomonospora curvata DSM 43183]|uniref:Uncharacterized protein n=1 Tax=Thermomonospora curvata (strain ATCC 19995 / DSM 43183 / JCM 3096 / KCTC 9072 / NBRC 15933 / NCIMB 10081 / Henssen B9) TaxID=471852 RepID=D1ACL3_THECD|nr:hypothetical protein Tcur_3739 [Thermomonospora curvata DSM 43183]PKK12332.1 MAG: hypothetical protein BUE48_018340 [Thermomonospora sp. CIF 1]